MDTDFILNIAKKKSFWAPLLAFDSESLLSFLSSPKSKKKSSTRIHSLWLSKRLQAIFASAVFYLANFTNSPICIKSLILISRVRLSLTMNGAKRAIRRLYLKKHINYLKSTHRIQKLLRTHPVLSWFIYKLIGIVNTHIRLILAFLLSLFSLLFFPLLYFSLLSFFSLQDHRYTSMKTSVNYSGLLVRLFIRLLFLLSLIRLLLTFISLSGTESLKNGM